MTPVIMLLGPTATGKTTLSFTIAEHFPIEIISIDSTNVYRGMDIGTAKPSLKEQSLIPHHLIDIRDPWDTYSAGQCCLDARKLIQDIQKRERIPLLVGGTMLYFQTLLRGYDGGPTTSPEVRDKVLADAEKLGWKALWKRLHTINPDAALRLHPNDKQRVGRALERELMLEESPNSSIGIPPLQKDYSIIQLALKAENRDRLREKIATRLMAMMELGFLDEVRKLLSHPNITPDLPSLKSVGYAQACKHLNGDMDFNEMFELTRIATNQLAKRQHTWLNQFPKASLHDCFDPNTPNQILSQLRTLLG